MVFVGMNLIPRASFLTQSDWSAFFSNKLLCVRKEALHLFIQALTDLHLPEVKTQFLNWVLKLNPLDQKIKK